MTRNEVMDWLNNSEDGYDYSKHELLVNLTCVFESDDGETEVTFAVPVYWILETLEEYPKWGWIDLQKWLDSEYTSEDSQYILEKAIQENKIAFWKIS